MISGGSTGQSVVDQTEVGGVRRVIVYELVSLDGVAEAPETFFEWDEVMDANLGEIIATQDAGVLTIRGERPIVFHAGHRAHPPTVPVPE